MTPLSPIMLRHAYWTWLGFEETQNMHNFTISDFSERFIWMFFLCCSILFLPNYSKLSRGNFIITDLLMLEWVFVWQCIIYSFIFSFRFLYCLICNSCSVISSNIRILATQCLRYVKSWYYLILLLFINTFRPLAEISYITVLIFFLHQIHFHPFGPVLSCVLLFMDVSFFYRDYIATSAWLRSLRITSSCDAFSPFLQ